jgi:general secretion pathway protein G
MKRLPILFASLAAVVGISAWAAYRLLDSEERIDMARAQLVSLEMKVRAFQSDTQLLPNTLQDLLVQNDIANWRGPYAKSRELLDPWGHAIQNEPLGQSNSQFRLSAVGASGNVKASVTYP